MSPLSSRTENLKAPHVSMVAGETSGDLLASLLIPEIKNRWPDIQMSGIGGPKMIAHGFQSKWPMEKLSVRGYVEVLKHYRELVQIRTALLTQLIKYPPDLFIGIDAPDFNLDLAYELRKRRIPTIQFVCPSIWAWRADRVKKIKASIDHVLCIFPFETKILAEAGISSTFVGHPLANLIPIQPDKNLARQGLGLQTDDVVVVILPGSRRDEIHQMAPRFLKAIEILQKVQPHIIPILPIAPGMEIFLTKYIKNFPLIRNLKIFNGKSHECMAAADVAMVASGTATLETALFKCPMVISYAMPWLSWQITQTKRLQPWVGLPNILCGNFVVPEFLQTDATPKAIANGILHWLDNPNAIAHLKDIFLKMHKDLRLDTPRVARNAIEKFLER